MFHIIHKLTREARTVLVIFETKHRKVRGAGAVVPYYSQARVILKNLWHIVSIDVEVKGGGVLIVWIRRLLGGGGFP